MELETWRQTCLEEISRAAAYVRSGEANPADFSVLILENAGFHGVGCEVEYSYNLEVLEPEGVQRPVKQMLMVTVSSHEIGQAYGQSVFAFGSDWKKEIEGVDVVDGVAKAFAAAHAEMLAAPKFQLELALSQALELRACVKKAAPRRARATL